MLVTEFKARYLRILREAERTNKPGEISRHGKARILPVREPGKVPWRRTRGLGTLRGAPGDSVFPSEDWEASRGGR
jgi:hypothetical protein